MNRARPFKRQYYYTQARIGGFNVRVGRYIYDDHLVILFIIYVTYSLASIKYQLKMISEHLNIKVARIKSW